MARRPVMDGRRDRRASECLSACRRGLAVVLDCSLALQSHIRRPPSFKFRPSASALPPAAINTRSRRATKWRWWWRWWWRPKPSGARGRPRARARLARSWVVLVDVDGGLDDRRGRNRRHRGRERGSAQINGTIWRAPICAAWAGRGGDWLGEGGDASRKGLP